jgi:hypothetical protein
MLATGFAGLLFISLLLNWIFNPARQLLENLNRTEYQASLDGAIDDAIYNIKSSDGPVHFLPRRNFPQAAPTCYDLHGQREEI